MSRQSEIDQAFNEAYAEDAAYEVKKILERLPQGLLYHGASHTFDFVYPQAMRIAKAEGLNGDERLVIAVQAIFHDTGFEDMYVSNEPSGALKGKEYAENSRAFVLRGAGDIIYDAILNTNMQEEPKNMFEMIMRDADLSILGLPEFLEWSDRLREETLLYPESGMYQFAVDDQKWANQQLRFLESRQWYTESARKLYDAQKSENIRAFKVKFADVLS